LRVGQQRDRVAVQLPIHTPEGQTHFESNSGTLQTLRTTSGEYTWYIDNHQARGAPCAKAPCTAIATRRSAISRCHQVFRSTRSRSRLFFSTEATWAKCNCIRLSVHRPNSALHLTSFARQASVHRLGHPPRSAHVTRGPPPPFGRANATDCTSRAAFGCAGSRCRRLPRWVSLDGSTQRQPITIGGNDAASSLLDTIERAFQANAFGQRLIAIRGHNHAELEIMRTVSSELLHLHHCAIKPQR